MKTLVSLLAAGIAATAAYAAENPLHEKTFIEAVLSTAKTLEKPRAPGAKLLFSSPPKFAGPGYGERLPVTNVVVLAPPPQIDPGRSFTLTIAPETGYRIKGVALIVERTVPIPDQPRLLNFAFQQPNLQKPEPMLHIGKKVELIAGTTGEFSRSEAPGPALFLRFPLGGWPKRKF